MTYCEDNWGGPSESPSPGHNPATCDCPPRTCEDCGETTKRYEVCSCWISLEGLPLADIKGLLALGGLSVDPRSRPVEEGR